MSSTLDRPVIGLVTQTHPPLPGQVTHCWSVGQRYVQVLATEGGIPWPVPLVGDEPMLRSLYERLDGVLLTGGADLNPGHYGEEQHPLCQLPDVERDRVELQLVRWAIAEGKPAFGICRGLQTINVALGGTLLQDVGQMHPYAIKHDYFTVPGGVHRRDEFAHEVRVKAGSRLAKILGSDRLPVNSLHHQGIKQLAPGLTATAWAPDDLIEALEGTGESFLLAVQWHPEELTEVHAKTRRLFRSFLDAAQAFRSVSERGA